MRGLAGGLVLVLFALSLPLALGAESKPGPQSSASAVGGLSPEFSPAEFDTALSKIVGSRSPGELARLLADFGSKATKPETGRLAQRRAGELYVLNGAFLEAGRVFEAAALRPPRDSTLLLMAARAYLAAGEDRRAGELAALLLASERDGEIGIEARLVAAWAAFLDGSPASARALAAPLLPSSNTARGSTAREARFLLWAAATGKERSAEAGLLASEQPGSAEALIAGGSPLVFLAPLPHWYLGGALEGRAGTEGSEKVVDVPTPAAATEAAVVEDSASPRLFQIGIFSKRENAEALAVELSKKGFSARIEGRKVSGRDLLAVVVEAGSSPGSTGDRLKDAGYEAYPLF